MIYDLCIVVPIGVSSPGTPLKKYLQLCIDSLKNQKTNYKYKVVFAADNNVSDEIKNIINESGFGVEWFEPYYFMRRGGIWKKIYTVWEKENAKYIAFCHYDDLWSQNKVQSQLELMERERLEITWSKVIVIDAENRYCSDDICSIKSFTRDTIYRSSYAFCHSSIINKEELFNCGIFQKVEKASAIYERLQYVYSHKLKGKKDENSIFFHRVHEDSVTHNFNFEKDYMMQQRQIANYSLQEVMEDANSISIINIINEVLGDKNGLYMP